MVVITGRCRGVGRAAALAFAKRGAHIGLIARADQAWMGSKERKGTSRRRAARPDAAVRRGRPAQVEAAAAKAEEEFGPIDIWVNVAMVSVFSPFKR